MGWNFLEMEPAFCWYLAAWILNISTFERSAGGTDVVINATRSASECRLMNLNSGQVAPCVSSLQKKHSDHWCFISNSIIWPLSYDDCQQCLFKMVWCPTMIISSFCLRWCGKKRWHELFLDLFEVTAWDLLLEFHQASQEDPTNSLKLFLGWLVHVLMHFINPHHD